MYYRRKLMLALLQEAGGNLGSTDMQKLLFLFCEARKEKAYEFVPYKFGGVSFQSYADKRTLIKYGHLKEDKNWVLDEKGHGFLSTLNSEDRLALEQTMQKYGGLRGRDLVRSVYLKHPYFAIRSEILDEVLSPEERRIVEAEKPSDDTTSFFTIGYEGISLEGYLNKLIRNNIKLLCDVRKNPLSMKYGFSKNQLKDACSRVNITYLHLPALGIASQKRRELKTEADRYKLFEEYERTTLQQEQQSLIQLTELLKKYNRMAITCFEACELHCHRSRVAKALQALPDWTAPVRHL